MAAAGDGLRPGGRGLRAARRGPGGPAPADRDAGARLRPGPAPAGGRLRPCGHRWRAAGGRPGGGRAARAAGRRGGGRRADGPARGPRGRPRAVVPHAAQRRTLRARARRLRPRARPPAAGSPAQRAGGALGDGGGAALGPPRRRGGRGPQARSRGEPPPAARGRGRRRIGFAFAAARGGGRERRQDPLAHRAEPERRACLARRRPGALAARPAALPGGELPKLDRGLGRCDAFSPSGCPAGRPTG